MNSRILKNSCNVLSVVDLFLIGSVFFYFQSKITKLEKGDSTDSVVFSSKIKEKENENKILEKRILRIEKDNEVLLQRMQCYDELFSKILSHIKENNTQNSQVPKILDPNSSPNRRTYLQRRTNDSVLTRKEPFIDDEEDDDIDILIQKDEDDDDEMFSFLKD